MRRVYTRRKALCPLGRLTRKLSNSSQGAIRVRRSYSDLISKAVPDLMFVLDADGNCLECWGPEEDLTAGRAGVLGKNIANFLREDVAAEALAIIRRALETQKTVCYKYRHEIRGDERFFSARITSLSDYEALACVRNVTEMHREQDELEQYRVQLENMVDVRTRALSIAVENLKSLQKSTVSAHLEVIHRLSAAAEYKDKETGNHIVRMSEYAALLGRLSGFSEAKVELIRQASPMHDVGKIGIPDAILTKPGKLTAQEWETMKLHTVYGAEILSSAASEHLDAAHIIALTHHEKWDGSGYPIGLCGESIPLFGRICAVSDVFDALTSERPYKRAYANEEALAIMKEERETHFDPRLLDLFVDHFDDFRAVKVLCSE